ncbi:uncharacterized protein TNCV_1055011 [Trichonephila clavipes]|nr:uncharacterized protein TNCV_1055011 [Trichonephila clavipes]
MRYIGQGLSSLETFCSLMCLPNPVSQKAEEKIIDRTVNYVVVNGDGTWKTRGHTSLIGVCALIGADCGKVLDMEVMSSYCKGCDSDKGPKLGPKYSAFWLNITFSAEKTIADLLEEWKFAECRKTFLRSEQKHGLKYQRYIGDGDSKIFVYC